MGVIEVKNLNKSLEMGLIDFALKKQDLKLMDVVLLTIPVDVSINKLLNLLDDINDNTLVIDFGSTKSAICDAVAPSLKKGTISRNPPHSRY